MNATSHRAGLFKTILLAGVMGAVLIDLYLVITEGYIFHTANALVISQWDASNLLGPAAFRGGVGAALIGFLLHLTVSLIWAAIIALAAVRVRFIAQHPIVTGIAFGMIVRLVMAYVIVPLGRAQMPHANVPHLVNLYIAHTLAFGIPVAWIAAHAAKPSPAAA
jgi:hypothetical protein